MRRFLIFLIMLLALFVLTSCMAGSGRSTPEFKAGFFIGIWHGWIAPIALIVSIFDSSIKIYEVNNTGFWYELGFYMAIISGFGGISLFRKKKS
ncbi:MAG: hypothetical protein FWG98_03085 [Candidatus Cloacimonetes bacterium]|nr:hypothetical protein [Candidatus Cloacimonadota bacterium]